MCVYVSAGVEQLLGACRSLQKLSLERCDLTDRSCASIAANRSLTALNCALASGLTEVGLGRVLDGCTRSVAPRSAVCALCSDPGRRVGPAVSNA